MPARGEFHCGETEGLHDPIYKSRGLFFSLANFLINGFHFILEKGHPLVLSTVSKVQSERLKSQEIDIQSGYYFRKMAHQRDILPGYPVSTRA